MAECVQPFVDGFFVVLSFKCINRQSEYFLRCKSASEHIVEEEIMEFVRSHDIFCFLGDLSFFWRQKFRTHRRIQHIIEHLFQLLIFRHIRIITHQISYQRLRNGAVYPIHGHVVTIVSSPSKCQLRHVSGSDHHTPCLVGYIH